MSYRTVPLSKTSGTVNIPQRAAPDGSDLALDSPATAALTDFTRECPVTVAPGRHIDDALQDMIRAGVRALLVLDEGRVLGLITAYDILGERPIQFLQSGECVHDPCLHRHVTVADVMTGLERQPVLELNFVQSACVGDLMETFRTTGSTHLLVVEPGHDGESVARGLISRTRLERQTGNLKEDTALDRVRHRSRLSASVA